MIEILLIMSAGILIGYLIRSNGRLIRLADRMVIITILVLLFFMGFTIGRDPLIMGNLPQLGLTALILSVAGVTGSMLLALLVWKLYFRKNR